MDNQSVASNFIVFIHEWASMFSIGQQSSNCRMRRCFLFVLVRSIISYISQNEISIAIYKHVFSRLFLDFIDSCQMDLDSDKFVYNVVFRNVPTSNNEKILVRVLFDIIVYIFLPIQILNKLISQSTVDGDTRMYLADRANVFFDCNRWQGKSNLSICLSDRKEFFQMLQTISIDLNPGKS